MIKAAIAGGTGYTAGETIRILLYHPDVKIVSVLSTTSVGETVTSVHRDLLGETDIKFTDKLNDPDVLFLCLGHGLSREFIDNHNIPDSCKIIDLGNDFRIDSYYKERDFVYGLTDQNRDLIKKANNIANPGCFATAIQNAIIPIANAGLLCGEVHATGITGSTGAGKKPSTTSHFSWRDNNISIYKLFAHQHLEEIKNNLQHILELNNPLGHEGCVPQINFVPMRGDFTRGIFASVYTKWKSSDQKLKEAVQLYKDFYKDSPFTFVSDDDISLKDVVNTNKALIHVELHNGYIHVASVIDNLVKGAAGQAVENMNLMFGLPETEGLKFKPSAF
ncbi:MAG TPA: N-acetyl-gamma-glutamyl-phosphate reductase [Candidatus Egerieousia sp.]|nr:N-acetyl-gamma-glutamyl-phosphate reductase [Candidatus Egerieousia sp.]HPT05671.1 N-acetyl-gamma-glutamyl-phosphate reductase [Candidatus Egerieousia sp.]